MKINTYDDIKVTLIRSTENPLDMMSQVSRVMMTTKFKTKSDKVKNIVKFLLKANHTSPFEFIDYCFLIEGGSRSFLSQITRTRIASFSSSSQHYQNYKNFPHSISGDLTVEQRAIIESGMGYAVDCYEALVDSGLPIYEARQVLPNSSAVNLYFKINARALINWFNLRLCFHNTDEIRIVAEKMLRLCREHFGELFNLVGPDCLNGPCRQGKMQAEKCKKGYKWKLK